MDMDEERLPQRIFKFDTYWKKKKRETKNKMETRSTQRYERTWSTR
jgi:hypothetical protein